MDELDADAALADGGGDAIDTVGADIADREHAGAAGLEEQGRPGERPLRRRQGRRIEIGPGPDEPFGVERHAVAQPRGVRIGAGHQEHVTDRRCGGDAVVAPPPHPLQPRAALLAHGHDVVRAQQDLDRAAQDHEQRPIAVSRRPQALAVGEVALARQRGDAFDLARGQRRKRVVFGRGERIGHVLVLSAWMWCVCASIHDERLCVHGHDTAS